MEVRFNICNLLLLLFWCWWLWRCNFCIIMMASLFCIVAFALDANLVIRCACSFNFSKSSNFRTTRRAYWNSNIAWIKRNIVKIRTKWWRVWSHRKWKWWCKWCRWWKEIHHNHHNNHLHIELHSLSRVLHTNRVIYHLKSDMKNVLEEGGGR